jgi:hypothetical protein
MKAYGVAVVQPYGFLNSAVDEDQWSSSHPGSCTHGNKMRYALKWMLGGLQSQSGHFGEKPLLPAGIRAADCPARSLITTPSALSRLPFASHNCLLLRGTTSTFHEKLPAAQLVKKFLTFWGHWRFMSVHKSSLSQTTRIPSTHSDSSSLIHSPFQYCRSISTEVFQEVSFL